MSDWSSGYVTDIDYSFGYCDELNPLRVPFACLARGISPPRIEAACELGFGQGISVAIHAAASPVAWWGTDFMPSQAALAQTLAGAAGSNARLFDESFAEFCSRRDLPDFDFVGLHGIFSWVSEENRALIVDFLRRKLKVGGVVYISYNSLPGWSAFIPMRHLLVEHAALFGSVAQGVAKRLTDALAFGRRLLASEPLYGRANPGLQDRLQLIAGLNSTYLAHELFNRNWEPMHFTEMKRWLEPAKLSFVNSADYLDTITPILLTAEQHAIIDGLPDPSFRELLMDFMVNRQFRRDFWVKGPRQAPPLEVARELRRQSVVLARDRASVALRLEGAPREITLQPSVYAPILDALANHQPVTVEALERRLGSPMPLENLCEVLTVLFATGAVRPAQAPDLVGQARATSGRLNAALLDRAQADGSIRHLASPVTGGGIAVSRHQQLFLRSRMHGEPQADWAESAWRLLAGRGEQPQRDRQFAESTDESLQSLQGEVRDFVAAQLPVLDALGVAAAA